MKGWVASKLNIKSKTQVINWVKQFQEKGADSFDIETRGRGTGGKRGRPKTKFNSLEEEVEKATSSITKLKIRESYSIIKSMSMKYNICKLCKLAGVSRSGYYKWLNGTERFTDRAKENKIIKQLILEIHNKYRGTMDVKECV